MKSNDSFILGFILGCIGLSIINYFINTARPTDYSDVGGNIDIEYYLEVSEDSIWIESVDSKQVYCGKYSELEKLINLDNL